MSKKHDKSRRTARFWVWHMGWVKLTLRFETDIHLSSGGPTDEGFHYSGESYSLDGAGNVVRESWSRSRDCDGPLDRDSEHECDVDDMAAEPAFEFSEKYTAEGELIQVPAMHDGKPIMLPDWRKVRSGQRDYYAEAMGY